MPWRIKKTIKKHRQSKNILEKNGFNYCDETEVSTVHKLSKIAAPCGQKQVLCFVFFIIFYLAFSKNITDGKDIKYICQKIKNTILETNKTNIKKTTVAVDRCDEHKILEKKIIEVMK